MNECWDKAAADGPRLGFCVMYPSPGVIERIGADWDWFWIDGQHGELDYADELALVRACDLVGRPALLRVPGHDFGAIGKALDCAPAGVIVPGVDTPRQAQAVVDAAKFPPVGKRSYGGRRPIDLWGRGYSDTANQDTLLVCQIESPEAVDNVDAIAATPGVDGLFLGPDDIGLRRGLSLTAPRSKESLHDDMDKVISACTAHGKLGVMVGIGDQMLQACAEMGFHLVVAGGDVQILSSISKTQSAAARELVKGGKAARVAAPGDQANSPY